MNAWVVVAVLLLGGALALAPVVWAWLDPLSPARSVERLLAVLSAWNGIRDIDARKVLLRGADEEIQVRLVFLAPANFRLEVDSPRSLAGEVFTLRPVADEWLLVHYRPALRLGVESRIRMTDLETLLPLPSPTQLRDGLRDGQIRVTYVPAPPDAPTRGDEFDIHGLPGQFPRAVLWVDPVSQVPWRVHLHADPESPPTLRIEAVVEDEAGRQLSVNTGLELRDVLRLDRQPERWLSPALLPSDDQP